MSNDMNAIIMNAADYMRLLNDANEKGYKHPEIIAKMDSMTQEQIDILLLYDIHVPIPPVIDVDKLKEKINSSK